jgi:hypothetical protein
MIESKLLQQSVFLFSFCLLPVKAEPKHNLANDGNERENTCFGYREKINETS